MAEEVGKVEEIVQCSKNADEILQELFDEQRALKERRLAVAAAEVQENNSGSAEKKSADDILNELFAELGQQPNTAELNLFSKKKKHRKKEKDKKKTKEDSEKKKPKHKLETDGDAEKPTKHRKSRESKHDHKAKKRSKERDLEEGEIDEASHPKKKKKDHKEKTLETIEDRRRRHGSESDRYEKKRTCPPRENEKYRDRSFNSEPLDNHGIGRDQIRRAPPRNSDADYSRHDQYRSRHYQDARYQNDYRGRRDRDDRYRRDVSDSRYSRSRSRSRSSRRSDEVFDKVKLLEIARRNASLLMKNGVLPSDIFSKDQIVAIKAGGKSVEELTSYCRRLARKEAMGEDPDGHESDGGESSHFIHHPFIVKERPMPQITLNIRNAIPLPVRTPQELAIENAVRKNQFPVSSGTHHRVTEMKALEWREVDSSETAKPKPEVIATSSKAVVPLGVPIVEKQGEIPAAIPEVIQPAESKSTLSLEPPSVSMDVGSIITVRLKAIRALKDNPDDVEAKNELNSAVQEMDRWAEAKALEPKFLTQSDLTSGPQAWAKRDQLKNAKQVTGGMGMHLLQKMGWKPGEGLGKNKEGTTEPLALDIKTDKKGLQAQEDSAQRGPYANLSLLYDLSGKHPVSALMELCTKRRWGPPAFDLVFEHGPSHQPAFVFKVTVNGVEYQPCVATNNKKLAKANAAAFCLQSLGLLKTTTPPPVPTTTLQTVPSGTPPSLLPPPDANFLPSHQLQTVPST